MEEDKIIIITRKPFNDWLSGLKNPIAIYQLDTRLKEIREGVIRGSKPLRKNVHEIRIQIASGVRIYYFKDGANIVVLLAAGLKGSQDEDIKLAIKEKERYLNETSNSKRI